MNARVRAISLPLCVMLFGLGCLDGPEGEEAGYSPHLRSERASVPKVEDDDRLRKRIDAADNIDGMQIPLHTAYADGQAVNYYDFGPASATARPVWLFRRRDEAGEPQDFGHLDLVDSAPGDMGYSAFRAQYLVYVTDAYRGERITSLSALEDALEIGLLEEPQPLGTYVDGPMALADTMLEGGSTVPAPLELRPLYYRGHVATCFALLEPDGSVKQFMLDERGMFQARSAYVLRRQNESRVLDEMVWMADLNEDGDKRDSNHVFTLSMMQPGFAALWRLIDVTVEPEYEFGQSRAESDMFQRQMLGLEAIQPPVIEYRDPMTLKNLVVWSDTP